MDRRDFIKKSGMVLGGLGVSTAIHPAILRAQSIQPEKDSTFYDAEHIVILMQENRSFDHCFGALKGVRGFADRRALRKPNGKSVFFQTDRAGKTYAPFHMNIKNTKATWMRSLPHSWGNQQVALNQGKYDAWLDAKSSGIESYSKIPLTLGYYQREDLPFYYQLADAFTVFDQNFCSSLTGTTPNRLFLWSGTIRGEKNGDLQPHVVNSTVTYTRNVDWKTFPEMLEEENISWRIYQNEISLPKGMQGEQDSYLANFTDNPIEWFSQYHVKFSPGYYEYAKKQVEELKEQIKKASEKDREKLEKALQYYQKDVVDYHPSKWDQLSDFEKSIHQKAFTINSGDPHFWELDEMPEINGEKMYLPKGDILFQFRKDVQEGKLPAVSWLVAPERFSDHPTSPWYGAWYISEVMNILTQNPEVWKKTIFIINYDENDGYFDHVVPFMPPNNPSQVPDIHGEEGIEYADPKQKYYTTEKLYPEEKTIGPIGLGFRVPMIIASPWTMGGYVNSEVTDHTSVLQFMEHFFNKKLNKNIHVDKISHWRREVCSNLTSAFKQSKGQKPKLEFVEEKPFMQSINLAKVKPVPNNYKEISEQEQSSHNWVEGIQEKGIRPSNPLDYCYDVNLTQNGIQLKNNSKKAVPLHVYNRLKLNEEKNFLFPYTLFADQELLHATEEGAYHWEVFGPNGFYRNFQGTQKSPVNVQLIDLKNGDVELVIDTTHPQGEIQVENLYTKKTEKIKLKKSIKLKIDSAKIGGWYDIKISSPTHEWHFAGRAETGKVSCSDPHWA